MADEKKRVVAPHDLSPDDFDFDTAAKVIRVKARGGLPSGIVTQLSVDDDGRMRWKQDGVDKVANLSDLIDLPDGLIQNLTFTDWGHVEWTVDGQPFTYDIYPEYTDDDRGKKLGIDPASGDLNWLPFALKTIVVGGTGLLNIDPVRYHGALVQLNETNTAVGFRIQPGTLAGELFAIVNRDEDDVMSIELAPGLSLMAHRGAQRTSGGGVFLMPTGTVWIRATNTAVAVWGDLVLTSPKVPELSTGGPLDRLAISETGDMAWMPMNLPSAVFKDSVTETIYPGAVHGRLVHIDPGPTEALEIAGGTGADDWFFIVNRTSRDLTIKGVTGVGINAVEDAVPAPDGGYILKHYGTIAVRTSVTNCKIWGDLRLTTDMPAAPEGVLGSVMTTGLTGEAAWSTGLTQAKTFLTVEYDDEGGESSFGWHAPVAQTSLGAGSTPTELAIDPVTDQLGMAHYVTQANTTSCRIVNQPVNDRRAVWVTNATANPLPVNKDTDVPTIVSAFGETPFIKPGGTIQITFDYQPNLTPQCILWGDLQDAP